MPVLAAFAELRQDDIVDDAIIEIVAGNVIGAPFNVIVVASVTLAVTVTLPPPKGSVDGTTVKLEMVGAGTSGTRAFTSFCRAAMSASN